MNQQSTHSGRQKVVAVAAEDPNVAEALVQAVCALPGDHTAVLVRTEKDWLVLEHYDLFFGIMEASLLRYANKTILNKFEHVVIFNAGSEPHRIVRSYFPSALGRKVPIVASEPHLRHLQND